MSVREEGRTPESLLPWRSNRRTVMGPPFSVSRRHRQPDMLLIRTTCVLYWMLLSFLLLAPNPLAVLGIRRPPGPGGGRGAHFLLFTLLALLVLASRWPMGRRLLVGGLVLVAFALGTELLQSLVPNRTVEVFDLAENLLGLAAGAGVWLMVRSRFPCPSSQCEG